MSNDNTTLFFNIYDFAHMFSSKISKYKFANMHQFPMSQFLLFQHNKGFFILFQID